MDEQTKTTLLILVRAFVIAALAVFLDNGADIFAVDTEAAKAILTAGVAAVAWTVFAWLNPRDTRIGVGSDKAE